MDEATDTHAPIAGEPAAAPSTQDAVSLLRADHTRIEALLDDVVRSAANDGGAHADRSGTVSRLGAVLKAHVQMEAELLNPLEGSGSAPAAHACHGELRTDLHSLVEAESADAATYTAALAQMQQSVDAHIAAQETQLLPHLEAASAELLELGTRMAIRRGELLGEQGVD